MGLAACYFANEPPYKESNILGQRPKRCHTCYSTHCYCMEAAICSSRDGKYERHGYDDIEGPVRGYLFERLSSSPFTGFGG